MQQETATPTPKKREKKEKKTLQLLSSSSSTGHSPDQTLQQLIGVSPERHTTPTHQQQ
jgi:hypothetical protein